MTPSSRTQPLAHVIEAATTIDAPQGEVFAFLADLRNNPVWNHTVTRVEQLRHGNAGHGSIYRQHRRNGAPVTLRVTDHQPPTRLAILANLDGILTEFVYRLDTGPEAMTHIRAHVALHLRLDDSTQHKAGQRAGPAIEDNLAALKHAIEQERRA